MNSIEINNAVMELGKTASPFKIFVTASLANEGHGTKVEIIAQYDRKADVSIIRTYQYLV